VYTPSVSFYLSLDNAKFHYPATNKKKRREYIFLKERPFYSINAILTEEDSLPFTTFLKTNPSNHRLTEEDSLTLSSFFF
jgi:hypothetical protein